MSRRTAASLVCIAIATVLSSFLLSVAVGIWSMSVPAEADQGSPEIFVKSSLEKDGLDILKVGNSEETCYVTRVSSSSMNGGVSTDVAIECDFE